MCSWVWQHKQIDRWMNDNLGTLCLRLHLHLAVWRQVQVGIKSKSMFVCYFSSVSALHCICTTLHYWDVVNLYGNECILMSRVYFSSVPWWICITLLFSGCSGLVVEYRTRNREVAGSTHTRSIASNLEQVANLLCAQANSASYPQRNEKWVVATATGWKPSVADWGSGVSASCTMDPIIR